MLEFNFSAKMTATKILVRLYIDSKFQRVKPNELRKKYVNLTKRERKSIVRKVSIPRNT